MILSLNISHYLPQVKENRASILSLPPNFLYSVTDNYRSTACPFLRWTKLIETATAFSLNFYQKENKTILYFYVNTLKNTNLYAL